VPLYTAVLVLTHLTGFQQAMATHMWIHDAETALYLISGYLLFLPLLGTELTGRWLVYPLRFVVLALCMGPDTLVGVALMLGSRALAPAYAASHPGWGPSALTDQRTAGAVMWVAGDGLMMLLMVITVLQWVRAGEGDRGLGPWLETIRRQATVGDVDTAVADLDVDDDEAALAAYNARLASLSAPVQHHPGPPGR
jgi:putative membrane protein